MTTLRASAADASVEVEVKRPSFQRLWDAYTEVGLKGYEEVYDLVGGNVAELRRENPDDYTNACALRMSRAFNYGGYAVPSGTLIPGTNIYRVRGGDGKPYIMRVNGVIHFVRHNWGEPDKVLAPDETARLAGLKGLIVIEVQGWSDATGHVTLWDGRQTGDGSTYQDPANSSYLSPSVSLSRVFFWELK